MRASEHRAEPAPAIGAGHSRGGTSNKPGVHGARQQHLVRGVVRARRGLNSRVIEMRCELASIAPTLPRPIGAGHSRGGTSNKSGVHGARQQHLVRGVVRARRGLNSRVIEMRCEPASIAPSRPRPWFFVDTRATGSRPADRLQQEAFDTPPLSAASFHAQPSAGPRRDGSPCPDGIAGLVRGSGIQSRRAWLRG